MAVDLPPLPAIHSSAPDLGSIGSAPLARTALPFGMKFREKLTQMAAGTSTTTTKTVSVTAGPDADTDPEDTGSD